MSGLLSAQPIDISLHPTANPDSFEVRLTSAATYDGILNAVFTIRWEVASGGVMSNSDVRRACGAYSFLGNTGTTVDVGPYRYFTVVIFGDRTMAQTGCPSIGPAGMVLGTVRIRQLSGCRNVSLVQNAFTNLNNLDYYMSVNGVDQTGVVTSAPIPAGDCPPCDPPVITGIYATNVQSCAAAVDLWATTNTSATDYSWYDRYGEAVGWTAQVQDPDGGIGTYTLIVSDVCGSDTATVEVLLDSAFCQAPVIHNAWYQPWSGGVELHVDVAGSCPGLSWTMPDGVNVPLNAQHMAHVNELPGGTHFITAVNSCGTDTVELFLSGSQGCERPIITQATITSAGPCHASSAVFSTIVNGQPGSFSTAWYGPQGTMLTDAAQLNLSFAPAGNYMFTAWNDCDADTAFVFHGPADTTGLALCVPPVIDTIHTVGWADVFCLGDTVRFLPVYTNAGICGQTRWSQGNTTLSWNDTVSLVLNSSTSIRFTVSNACGEDSRLIPVTMPQHHMQITQRLCTPVFAPLSLDSMMHLYNPITGGQWYRGGVLHGDFYDPEVDTSGYFHYCMPIGNNPACRVQEMVVAELVPAYAGDDTTVVACSTDTPFDLFDLLGEHAMSGGYWMTAGAPIFDPATSLPGVYQYRKTVGMMVSFCSHDAYVTVEVDSALTYYADTDGDGLGDPLDSLQSCDPLAGYVTEANDDCPLVFGTIGSPCDDGNALTINDSLGVDCQCVGLNTVGLQEATNAGWQLWPNPASDMLRLQGPPRTGRVQLHLLDAAGREVRRWQRTLEGAPLELSLTGLPSGAYALRIVGKDPVPVLRVVVQR